MTMYLFLLEVNNVSVLDNRSHRWNSSLLLINPSQPILQSPTFRTLTRKLRSSTMAKPFLERLPKIPLNDLPAGSSCMICLTTYGAQSAENGITESPVRLPCTHHVASQVGYLPTNQAEFLVPTAAKASSQSHLPHIEL